MNALVPEDVWQARIDAWTPPEIVSQTPWQEIYRTHVGQLADGGCLELATAYSNRGVLHARMGDMVGAREDFRLAIELDSVSGAPEHNRNWFEIDRMESLAGRTE